MSEHQSLPRVAIIIPTHNGQQYINELFQSIANSTYPKPQLGVFVVDNHSSDQTIARISNFQFPISKITIIRNDVNRFFAKAVNQGAAAAIQAGHEYLFLLNQDTVIDSNCIQALVQRLDNTTVEPLAAVQARMMLWPPESQTVNSVGNAIHYLGFGYCIGNGKQWPLDRRCGLDPESRNKQKRQWSASYASGAAMMICSKTWEQLGGFCELMEMYHEDLELGWRLALAGKKSACVNDAVVYHKYNFNPAPYKYYFMERNRLMVLLIHYQFHTLLLIAPIVVLVELGMIAFAIKNRWWREKLSSYRGVVRSFPQILTLRKKSMRSRTVTDSAIVRMMDSQILDQPIANWLLNRIGNPILKLYYGLLKRIV